ncbi:MAG TPA: hypothetical protein VGO09_08315 [Flavisolibacter sp.]|nr:hypothetical protein [Flavisolibacter sp.]
MNLDYTPLKKYIQKNEELTKEELLEKCSGEINIELFQSIKELEFKRIGKDGMEELYLI